jgi:hypothetical protein
MSREEAPQLMLDLLYHVSQGLQLRIQSCKLQPIISYMLYNVQFSTLRFTAPVKTQETQSFR